ncbi:MAG: hypothetical protein JXA33_25970 [Anaerolineae bacterium]|nr:hypothetical protein [Anaerolineae bacterium]
MKIKKVLFWTITLVLLLPATMTTANEEPRLQLSANNLHLAMGQEIAVDLLVANAPLIYGVESHLAFDPAVLEVVDADPNLIGVQLTPGNFIDFEHAFVLQNQADNQAGTLDYALTLLNPAPPVQGNGVLAHITFRAKRDGAATIHIVSGLFGTQTGETISPIIENTEISLDSETIAEPDYPGEEPPASPDEKVTSLPIDEKNNGSTSFPINLAVLGASTALALVGIISFILSRLHTNTLSKK